MAETLYVYTYITLFTKSAETPQVYIWVFLSPEGTALLTHVLEKAKEHGNIDNIYL